MSLKAKIFLHLFLALTIVAAMLFIPAGSLKFWQGWTFIALVYTPVIFFYVYFYKHDPELIERRLQSKEKVRAQTATLTKMGTMSARFPASFPMLRAPCFCVSSAYVEPKEESSERSDRKDDS